MVEMQSDCNLELYTYHARLPLWAWDIFLSGTDCTTAMQVDGTMVVYNGDGSPLLSSKSYTKDYIGTFRFTIQGDGLAEYNRESGQILWAGYRQGVQSVRNCCTSSNSLQTLHRYLSHKHRHCFQKEMPASGMSTWPVIAWAGLKIILRSVIEYSAVRGFQPSKGFFRGPETL